MPDTKIINVLKNDRFEDILHIFRTTPATEVIFVLPKKSKSFSDEENFALLARESEEYGKTVLILSESQEINDLAASYDFGVLTSEHDDQGDEGDEEEESLEDDTEPQESDSLSGNTEHAEHEDYALTEDEKPDFKGDEDGEAVHYQAPEVEDNVVLAAAPKKSRSMTDIIGPNLDNSTNLKINKKSEKPFNLEVKREPEKLVEKPVEEPVEMPMEKLIPRPDFKERNALEEIQNVWQYKRETPKKVYNKPAPSFEKPKFSIGGFASKLSRKTMYLYGLGVVIIFGFVLYVSLGKAEIVIKPRTSALDFSMKVSSSDSFSTTDLDLKRIPGQLFSVEKKIDETFSATGEKDVVQKARGKITVYNEYGTTPQVLIATTRFESSDGYIFRTLKTVTVPGTTVANGKITPGTVEVEVIADKAGDVYNIEPGKFTIPAFKEKGDTDRYQKFYGKSTDPMKGGIVGKAKVVTEQDYVNAKKEVEDKVIAVTKQEVENQAAGLKILSMTEPVVKDITPSAQIDEATDTFIVSGTAVLNTVGFKESDLDDLIVKYVESVQNLQVFTDKLDIKYQDVKFNEDQKTLEFTLAITGPAYNKIDEQMVINDLMGKNKNSIEEYFKTKDEAVSSARVILSPFWVFKVPTDPKRVKVSFDYE